MFFHYLQHFISTLTLFGKKYLIFLKKAKKVIDKRKYVWYTHQSKKKQNLYRSHHGAMMRPQVNIDSSFASGLVMLVRFVRLLFLFLQSKRTFFVFGGALT